MCSHWLALGSAGFLLLSGVQVCWSLDQDTRPLCLLKWWLIMSLLDILHDVIIIIITIIIIMLTIVLAQR